MVDGLGVFPQGHFHGHRRLDHHVVHPPPPRLERAELAADGVGAARAGHHGGHAGFPRLLEAAIQRINRVHRPQLGGAGIGVLVAVVPLEAEAILPHTQMGMGVHKARQQPAALRVQHLAGRIVRRRPRPYGGNPAILHIQIAIGDHPGRFHGIYPRMYDSHRAEPAFPGGDTFPRQKIQGTTPSRHGGRRTRFPAECCVFIGHGGKSRRAYRPRSASGRRFSRRSPA